MKVYPQYIENQACCCGHKNTSNLVRCPEDGSPSEGGTGNIPSIPGGHIGQHIREHIHIHDGIADHIHISEQPEKAGSVSARMVGQGRYSGQDRFADIEIRVDHELGIVSGDIFRTDRQDRTWVTSFRTQPGEILEAGRRLDIVAVDRHSESGHGQLHFTQDASVLRVTLTLDAQLDSLPFRREFGFYLEKTGDAFRRLGIEVELEHGVAPVSHVDFNGVEYTFEDVMKKAGFDVESVGRTNVLPLPPKDGWSEKSLETVMHDLAQSDKSRPNFDLRMLCISYMNRKNVLGVMFDIDGEMQRQGFAVCQSALKNRKDIPDDRRAIKTLQTAVHEAGHALNLAHRFEREVGRADSLSPMNYDWKYRGGGQVDAFWRDFQFKFDNDELEFMRHGSFRDVVPGGAAFHSVRYWADGNGGYAPYVPQAPLHGWDLKLHAPIHNVMHFGQPVTVGLELTNMTGRPQAVPGFLLDQKAGFVQFLIEREGSGQHQHFHPITHRCYDLGAPNDDQTLLPGGAPLTDNANLTFGISGFPFAEPGNYRIRAVLSIYRRDQNNDVFEQVTLSNAIRLRVSMPQTRDEERDAFDLLQPHIGQYFAFGGLQRLQTAEDTLLEIAERRDRTKSGVVRDPIAAHIHRCAGFNAGRMYLRHINGEFLRQEADQARAKSHFDRLDAESLKCVDEITRQATMTHINAAS